MGRWEPNARGRLERAALELYAERVFEQTTVAEIAGRAGLTERTFFRHFADKREVLFAGSAGLRDDIVNAVALAPASATPMEAIAAGLDAAAGVFPMERREHARRRAAVIAANAELRERELTKMASYSAAFVEALRKRGIGEPAASLAAEIGVAVFKIAFARWLDESNDRGYMDLVRESFAELKTVAAAD
jgi:AcrR family transcriptional regulator